MIDNFNLLFSSTKKSVAFIIAVGGIVAYNFQYIFGFIFSIDGNTTISISFNLHTAAILILFTWVGLIQIYLLIRKQA